MRRDLICAKRVWDRPVAEGKDFGCRFQHKGHELTFENNARRFGNQPMADEWTNRLAAPSMRWNLNAGWFWNQPITSA
jgi:hypothetical protein